jgi:hypothetical protein
MDNTREETTVQKLCWQKLCRRSSFNSDEYSLSNLSNHNNHINHINHSNHSKHNSVIITGTITSTSTSTSTSTRTSSSTSTSSSNDRNIHGGDYQQQQ